MNREEMVAQIEHSARVLVPLHKRVHTTLRKRGQSESARMEWAQAASEFSRQHKDLCFIGGWLTARDRIRSGDQIALEYALAFLEVRPYFFRSGYMFVALIKCLNSVPMTVAQRRRYDAVKASYVKYKRSKKT